MDLISMSLGSILSNPIVLLGIGFIMAGAYFVLHRVKYSNDVYFPFKKHQKITGVFKTIMPGKSAVIDYIDNKIKIGEKGMYVPSLNKLYSSVVAVTPGKPPMISFIKGVDGNYYPAMETYVTVDNLTDVDKVAKRNLGLEEDETKKVKATFLTTIVPTIQTYRAMMTSHIRDYIGLITDNSMKEEKQGLAGALDNANLVMIIMALMSIAGVYLVFDGSATRLMNVYNSIVKQQELLLTEQGMLINWCSESVKAGQVLPFPDLSEAVTKVNPPPKNQTTSSSNNLLNVLG